MRNADRTLGEDIKAYALTIPAAASNAKTLITCFTISTAEKRRVASWEITDNTGTFRWSKNSGMTAPNPAIAAYVGWEPNVRGTATWSNTYVRAGTGGAAVTGYMVVTFGDEE